MRCTIWDLAWLVTLSLNVDYSFAARDVSIRVPFNKPYLYAERYSFIKLTCTAMGFPEDQTLSYQWAFNSRILDGEIKENLFLNEITPEDHEGYYTCTVTDSIESSNDTKYLNMQYEPTVDQIRVVTGKIEGTSTIECWFKGFPRADSNLWLLNDQSIDISTTCTCKHMVEVEYDYDHGITKFILEVKQMKEHEYGDYKVIGKNKFGQSQCTVRIHNPDIPKTAQPPTMNSTDPLKCCEDLNVTGVCLELCDYDVDIVDALSNSSYKDCLSESPELLQCRADGRDYSKCCKAQGVQSYCLPFCGGYAPENFTEDNHSLCDVDGPTIFQCSKEGRDLIPSAPNITTLTKGDVDPRSIVLRWEPPEINRQYVQFYKIYQETSDPNVKPENHVVDELILDYEIRNVKPGINYTIYMTAGNEHGESQHSETFLYTVPSKGIQGPRVVTATISDYSKNVVSLLWDIVRQATYEVHYRQVGSTSYVTETVTEHHIELRDLTPSKDFLVYVVAIISGNPSDPTKVTRFSVPPADVEAPSAVYYRLIPDTRSVGVSWHGTLGHRYMLFYKEEGAPAYTGIHSDDMYEVISDLRSDTKYMVYVVAYTNQEGVSAESSKIFFKTDSHGDSDDDDTVAIAVGVTVGVIVLIAIILIILFVIYKKRHKNVPMTHSQTVSYSNQGHGATGSVKVDRQRNEYNNPAMEPPY